MFRYQELSEYYKNLISEDNKFAPDKFRSRINKNTPEFGKQLERDDAIDNVICEIRLLQARFKGFH